MPRASVRDRLIGPPRPPLGRLAGLALFLLLAVGGCAGQAPAIIVDYAGTPSPVVLPATATPRPVRRRRPTRIPLTSPPPPTPSSPGTPALASSGATSASSGVPASPTDLTTTLVAAPVATSTTSDPNLTANVTSTEVPIAAATGAPADPATTLTAEPTTAAIDPVPSATVEPALATTDSPTPDASVAIVNATPTTVGSPASGFPGQVSADQGLFVTSSGKTSKYYYARSDNGWHRIHADHQVWFLSADALLRVFPGRRLHARRTPTPTLTPAA